MIKLPVQLAFNKREKSLVLILCAIIAFSVFYKSIHRKRSAYSKQIKADYVKAKNELLKIQAQMPALDLDRAKLAGMKSNYGILKSKGTIPGPTYPGARRVLRLREVHGTTARISFTKGRVHFFAGGASYHLMCAKYDTPELTSFAEQVGVPFVVYGEVYAGNVQGMRATYGDEQLFIGFEATVDGEWLSVPAADKFITGLGLDFVPWVRIPATLEAIESERDKPSEVAARRGITEPRLREGVVLHPVEEMLPTSGRLNAKHKSEAFRETRTPRKVIDPEMQVVLSEAKEVAEEWVTEMRVTHVIDKLRVSGIEDTPKVVKAVLADVEAESIGEVIWSKEVRKAVGKAAAKIWIRHVRKIEA